MVSIMSIEASSSAASSSSSSCESLPEKTTFHQRLNLLARPSEIALYNLYNYLETRVPVASTTATQDINGSERHFSLCSKIQSMLSEYTEQIPPEIKDKYEDVRTTIFCYLAYANEDFILSLQAIIGYRLDIRKDEIFIIKSLLASCKNDHVFYDNLLSYVKKNKLSGAVSHLIASLFYGIKVQGTVNKSLSLYAIGYTLSQCRRPIDVMKSKKISIPMANVYNFVAFNFNRIAPDELKEKFSNMTSKLLCLIAHGDATFFHAFRIFTGYDLNLEHNVKLNLKKFANICRNDAEFFSVCADCLCIADVFYQYRETFDRLSNLFGVALPADRNPYIGYSAALYPTVDDPMRHDHKEQARLVLYRINELYPGCVTRPVTMSSSTRLSWDLFYESLRVFDVRKVCDNVAFSLVKAQYQSIIDAYMVKGCANPRLAIYGLSLIEDKTIDSMPKLLKMIQAQIEILAARASVTLAPMLETAFGRHIAELGFDKESDEEYGVLYWRFADNCPKPNLFGFG